MKAGLCECEDVLGRECGEGFEEEEERGDEEDCEGARDGGRDGADGDAVDGWGGARFAVVAYCFGEEDGSEEEGEGFDSVVWLVGFRAVEVEGRLKEGTHVPQETPIVATKTGVG